MYWFVGSLKGAVGIHDRNFGMNGDDTVLFTFAYDDLGTSCCESVLTF